MIPLYGFRSAMGVVDLRPFVVKVDTLLRLAKLPYEKKSGPQHFSKAPKKKLPFIEDDGQVIADSYFIAQHLKDKYEIDFDSWLTPDQKAQSYLITKSLEENFYFCIVYSRWIKSDVWPEFKTHAFAKLPMPLKLIVPPLARKGVISTLDKQGISRHSDEEILHIYDQTLQQLSTILGNKPYFMGDKMCSLDIVAYAMLVQMTMTEMETSFTRQAKQYSNLVEFCQRFQQQLASAQKIAA